MGSTSDVEYRGQVVVDAKYYEYWSTWVNKTCSKQVCHTEGSGKNAKQVCHTEYYDCSYCDENEPYWEVTDNNGSNYGISKNYYAVLTKQWNTHPGFINMKRDIETRGSCGINGNAYLIEWDKRPESAESTVKTATFTNRILASKSAFSYPTITQEDKDKQSLYDYPKINGYKQDALLGFDRIPIASKDKEIFKRKFEYLNGLGYKHHAKVFILLFPNKQLDIAFKQEAYWVGGKKNQLTICVGYDPLTYKMTWVKAFSWDKDKRATVEAREELMEVGNVLQWGTIYNKVYYITNSYCHPRDFEDFNYLEIELPNWLLILIYVLSLLSTIGISYWIVVNEFENEDDQNFKQKRY